MVSLMEVNKEQAMRTRLADAARSDGGERRAQAARMIPAGDLSRDLGKIGLAALGKRSKGFARFAGL